MLVQSSSVDVAIRSNTLRIEWASLVMMLTCDVVVPASYCSRATDWRSTNASLAARPRSSVGSTSCMAASERAARSRRAAKPSGERSVSSLSWPGMPK